jgi:hypothetical protein
MRVPKKLCGMMPTITNGLPWMMSVEPRRVREFAKARVQKR